MKSAPIEHRQWLLLAVAVIVAALCYFKGLGGGLYFDDTHVLMENQHIKVTKLDWESLRKAAASFGGRGREVSMLTFGLNHYFFGESIRAMKAVNLAIHLCTGVVFFLLARLLILASAKTREDERTATLVFWVPVIAAALWMLFPINLGAVLYISQRMNLLATLFVALGLVLYLKIRMSDMPGTRKTMALVVVSVVFSGLGYMSKENGILLLAYIALAELVLFQDFNGWIAARLPRTGMGRWLMGLFLLAALIALWILIQPYLDRFLRGYAIREFTLYERVLTQFRAISFYLSQILVPNNAELSMWHDDIRISTGLFQPLTTIVSVITILGLLFLAVVSVFHDRLISFGIFWFFIGHSLESTFIPLEMIHEHRNYMPGFGVALFLGYILLSSTMIRLRIALSVALLFWLFNAAVLQARSDIWSGDVTKAAHEALHHPESALAQFSYARYLYVAAVGGEEVAREAAQQLLEHNMAIDRKSVASEMLLVMLAYNAGAEKKQAWIDSAISKIDAIGYSAINSRALSGVLDHLKKDREADWRFVEPLYTHLENSNHPQFLTFAGVFHLEISQDVERGYELLEKVSRITNRRPAYQVNLIRAQLKLRRIGEACEALKKMEAMPSERIMLFQDEITKMREWLGDRCV